MKFYKIINFSCLTTSFLFMYLVFSSLITPQSLFLEYFTTDEGLAQNTVFSILQDSENYLWFATEVGVSRFNGIDFESFEVRHGLVSSTVRFLYEDSRKNIWMGTTNGISRFSDRSFVNFNTEQGLTDNYIYSILEDDEGYMWFSTRSGGISKLVDNRFINMSAEAGYELENVFTSRKDSRGRLWFGTLGSGVLLYENNSFVKYTVKDGLPSNNVRSIYEDRYNQIWFGTDKGVAVFKDETKREFARVPEIPNYEVRSIIEDLRGNIWIGFYGNGICMFNGEKSRFYNLIGFESEHIQTAIRDERGDIWFGSFLGGVGKLPADWIESYTEIDKLADDNVFAIAEDHEGNLYFGHFGYGVTILKKNGTEYLSVKNGLISDKVASILVDKNNNIWFGTLDGASRLSGKKITNFNKSDGMYDDLVLDMLEDRKGDIWFASSGGVSKYSPLENKFVMTLGGEDGLKKGWINDIHEDPSGNIWFATEMQGVVKYDGESITVYDTSNGLKANYVMSITQDKLGNYWFATDGGGISRFDGQTIENLTLKEGLSEDVCYFIMENLGYLYIGTTNGLTKFDYINYETMGKASFKYYTRSNGLPSAELNQGAYCKDNKGFLWFGTQKGVAKIDPDLQPEPFPPKVYFKEVYVSDGKTDITLDESGNNELKYNQNNLTFQFYTIAFVDPKSIVFNFRLDGIENNWTESTQRSVSYRALPYSKYEFIVRAKNSDGIWSELKSFKFEIKPPFYATWWFTVLSFFAIFSLIYYMYRYKTYQVKKRNEELAEMVMERTRELEEEKIKSDQLLHNILPARLVDELKLSGKVEPREFKNISILFTDFQEFSYASSVLPADKLVSELNQIFGVFDQIVDKYSLEKLKTIGDSYMVAGGIPKETDDHALRIVCAAIEMQKTIQLRNDNSPIKWEMRSGIHSGNVIAGIVGTKKFTYDVWGDTVNIASRMETSGETGRINISGYTYMLIKEYFECDYRGKIDAKGKGKIDMYYIKNIKEDKYSELAGLYSFTESPSIV